MKKRQVRPAAAYRLIAPTPQRQHWRWPSFGISALLALPLLGLLYLLHQLLDLPFLPGDFFIGFIAQLPGVVRLFGVLLTVGAALALNVRIGDALVSLGEVGLVLLFVLNAGLIGVLGGWLFKARGGKNGGQTGALWGALWGVGLTAASLAMARTPPTSLAMLARYAGALLLFIAWGAVSGWATAQWLQPSTSQTDPAQPIHLPRRRFLLTQLAAGALAITLVSGAASFQLARRQKARTAAFTNPAAFPRTLRVQVYPTVNPATGASLTSFQFPEFARPRYRPEQHPIGVCFSGGGPLSLAASVGQMRGLWALGLLEHIGAISAVSGGAWFGTLFTYAPPTIDDTTLLGAVVEPAALTLEQIATLDPHYLAAPVTSISTERIGALKTAMMAEIGRYPNPPFSRLYARTLSELLLKPFDLDDPHRLFTLDQAAVTQIIVHNPDLRPADFYTVRPDRPYFIAGVAQAYPLGEDQRVRGVEVTPLYTGLPQFFPGEGPAGLDIGGGYVESFAFDATAPVVYELDDSVRVPTPDPPFLLSDLIGSSGAAPGELLNTLLQPEWFPKFTYWSPAAKRDGAAQSAVYSFVDGGSLEGTGIIPLLRRHYPVIVVFLNTDTPIDGSSTFSVAGFSRMVTRLFGLDLTDTISLAQDAQVFPRAQLADLQAGLRRAKAEGRGAWFMDAYEVVQPNAFGIPPYPGAFDASGKVTVIWFYNERNEQWWQQLPPAVRALFATTDPTNKLSNFPNYDIVAQNKTTTGLPQLLNLTPQQINLLAHMHCYTVMHDAGETLLGFVKK